MVLNTTGEVNMADSDDDFFTKRDVPEDEQDKFAQYLEENVNEEMKKNVKNYLQATPEDEKERFLLDYIKNMRWKDDGDDFDLEWRINRCLIA